MIKVKNNETGKVEELADDSSLPDLVASGKVSLPNKEFEFSDDSGTKYSVPAKGFAEAVKQGWKYRDSSILHEEKMQKEYGDNPIEAGAVGTASGLTLGLSDYLLTKAGYPEERLKEISERNPIAHGIGEYGSTIAAMLYTGGASAVAKGTQSAGAKILAKSAPAVLSNIGERVAAKAAGELTEGIGKAALKGVISQGIEGAGYAAGNLLTEAAMGDAELNAENLLAATGKGAIFGSIAGGTLGASAKAASKYVDIAKQNISSKLEKLAQEGDVGILKWAGANKSSIKKLLNTESLDEKEMSEYVLDLTNFGDSVDSIVANGGVTKTAGKGLLKQITTKIDDISEHNQVVKDASVKLMNEAVERLDDSFLTKYSQQKINDADVVFGSDLAKEIEEKFVKKSEGLFDPQADDLQKFADQLKSVGTEVLPDGRIARVPLTPRQLRDQSIIFGRLAKFEKMNPTGKEEAYRAMRSSLEDKIIKGLKASDDSGEMFNRYMAGKKLYQKSSVAQDMINNKIASEIANNRGLSLTEGLAAATGAAALGPIGAVGGYVARKAQREYGDIAISTILNKIQKRTQSSERLMSAGVKDFFKDAGKGVRSSLIKSINSDDYEKDKKQLENFYTNPFEAVQSFNDNNRQLMNIAPNIGNAAQNKIIAGIEFMKAKFPSPQEEYIGQEYEPSRSEVSKFNDYKEAVDNPSVIFEQMKEGYINPRAIEVLKTVYPKMYTSVVEKVMENMPKKLTRQQRIQLQPLLGVKVMPAMDPDKFQILQRMTPESQQAGQQANEELSPKVASAQKMKSSQRNMSGLDSAIYRS